MLLYTKFRVNQTINRPDIAEMAAVCHVEFAKLWHFVICDRPWKRNLQLPTKLRWNRMIPGWDIAIKLFSKWRPSAMLNFRNLVFWTCVILLYPTKFRVNRIIIHRDIAKIRFSIWQPSAILNLQNFGILLSRGPWNHNLHLRTKFRWNRMISGWDIAIKPFSKWRPSAILNFWNLVFWSYDLC